MPAFRGIQLHEPSAADLDEGANKFVGSNQDRHDSDAHRQDHLRRHGQQQRTPSYQPVDSNSSDYDTSDTECRDSRPRFGLTSFMVHIFIFLYN